MRHLLFFLLLFIFGHSHAQDYIVNVQQFGIENGLAGRDVGILFIDRDGFLWISGHNYFQRYDGYDFKSYDLEGPGGKVHSIHSISQDEEGWLRMRVQYETTTWQLDILFFDPISGEVVSKEKKLDRQTAATLDLLSNTKKFAASSKPFDNSREYFSGTKNIIILDYTSKHLDTIPLSSSDDEKHSIQLIDHNGNFWMTKSREEECLLKANSKGVVQDSICPEEENRFLGHGAFEWNNQVYLIGKDRLNAYIGLGNLKRQTNGQDFIYKVNESGNLQTIFKAPFGYQVFKFFDGRIWCIGALGWKVYKLDGTFEFELNRADYGNALFENFDFASFIKDKSGKIYFGTAFGLNIIEAKRNPFKNYYSKKKNEQLSINNSARGIYEMEDEIIVNFEFGALVSIPKSNPDTFEIHASHSFNGEKTGKYNGRPILRDKNDNFLIGEAGYIRKWSSDFYQQEKIQLQEYIDTWSLWIDEEGCIWAGVNNGLAVTCDKQTSFTEYANKAIGIAHDRLEIYQIQSDSAGLVWLSTTQGLYAFDKNQKKVIEHYHSKGKGKYNLPAKLIYYLHIDKDNNKWFGTSNGLVFWNNKTNEKKLFNRNDGLSNNVIYAIKEDDYNRLWLSSDYGIMSFDKKSFAVRNYLPKDGTSDYEFNRVSHHQSKNGRIYFGSLNGVTSFHPKDFVENEKNHQSVAIANYEIFDGAETKLLNKTKELSDTKIITFHPRDRYFKLKFVLPTFDEQNKILYGWKMESVYEDWTYQKENTLQFSALPYGNHKLRIKGQGVSGGWSPHELVVEVRVLKPFYLQIWFLISTIALLLLSIWRYNVYRLNKLKRDKEKLELEVAQATTQIKADKAFIEQQAEELKKLDQLKSRFFANVSHELRTPLSLMLGPVKRLLEKPQNDSDRKLLEFVRRNSLHLKNLVNEILDLSKLENNKMELQEEPVKFYSYLKEHMAQFFSFGSSEEVMVLTEFPEKSNLSVLLDKNKFEKIINNFLSNALKFTPAGGQVKLMVEERDDVFHLMVEDTGRGIHLDDLPHVFDRFYQSRQANAPTEGGTGIGLSLCRELAELMEGKVWAESILGEGSTFHFQFPIKQTDELPVLNDSAIFVQDLEEPEVQQKVQTAAKILIAEDNADLRAYYEIILSDYDVVLTEHGQAALDYLEATDTAPGLIISDLMMPVMDGLQYLTHLKSNEQWRHIPVIMLTAKTNMEVKIQALRIGIDDYITKPFNDEELLVRIDNLLSHANARTAFIEEDQVVERQFAISAEDQEWLEAFETFVEKHLKRGVLTVTWLASEFAMSESSFFRQVKRLTGLSPSKYMQEFRLNQAKQLLENHTYSSISKVAFEVGFSDTKYFSRNFKKRYGKAPSAYLNN